MSDSKIASMDLVYGKNYLNYNTDKETFVKFLRKVTNMIRRSNAYRTYINSVKDKCDNKCVFFPNMSVEENIEYHHSPLTLFDICNLVVYDLQNKKATYNEYILAAIVIELHQKELVGLIPVSADAHKRIHAGTLKPYISHIYGDWVKLLSMYNSSFNYSFFEKVVDRMIIKPEHFKALESSLQSSDTSMDEYIKRLNKDKIMRG